MISVIMGSYNCKDEAMIDRSVRSIINQTYEDWEFIICDDGSEKSSFDLLQKIASLDSRIKLLHYPQNRGLAYALNQCISISQGEYIARQDDDDVSLPIRFEEQLRYLRSNPNVSFVGSNAVLQDATEAKPAESSLKKSPAASDFLWNSPFIHPTVMFRAEALRSVGGYRVSPETIRGQDYDLFMRMYAKELQGANLEECLYVYTLPDKNKRNRSMKYRLGEMKIRARGFSALNLGIKGLAYTAKPLLVGLMPNNLYRGVKNKMK